MGRNVGVAKGSSLVAVRVLDCQGSGVVSDVMAGLEWVAANAVRPAVVSLSLGIPAGAYSKGMHLYESFWRALSNLIPSILLSIEGFISILRFAVCCPREYYAIDFYSCFYHWLCIASCFIHLTSARCPAGRNGRCCAEHDFELVNPCHSGERCAPI